jgi:sarcosine oxidase subunit beta
VSERAGVLVLGGGVVGASLAWSLAERGVDGVVVVDLDLAGVYASSELNAGGARATWWQPVNVESCLATLDFFRAHHDEVSFRERGYLWLYDDPELYARALAKRRLQNGYGLGVEALATPELRERFPLLDGNLDEIVGATFSPRDGLVNPNAVRAWYRARAEERGVRFLDRHYVSGVVTRRSAGAAGSVREVASIDVVEVVRGRVTDEDGVVRDILTRHHVPPAARERELELACDALVNCLGAWSPIFSAKLGVPDWTEPVRRQLALVGFHRESLPAGADFDSLGMTVDPSGLYVHPEGPHLLAGFSVPEEPPGFDFHYDGDAFFEERIWPRLAHRSSAFERCGHVRGWAGLYAVTPDRSGIAGRVKGFANLFEAHSFTGRGVMQSYAVGRSMAGLVAEGRFDGVDLAPLTRERFRDPAAWVLEELHI